MRRLLGSCLSLLVAAFVVGAIVADEPKAAPVRIGMVQTFFTDVPKALISLVTEPFATVMRDTTGMNGELVAGGDVYTVAKRLSDKEVHLAVFHGFEFAWAQQKYPELKPLMVAMNQQREISVHVLVRKDNEAATFADLKSKEVSIPKRTKEHCRLFVERNCTGDAGLCDPKAFFSQIVSQANLETALDELCQGKTNAVVCDTLGLEFYKDLKPGVFAKFRVLKQSEPFPPAVIAFRQGGLDDAALNKVRDGLMNAHKTDLGREMMKMWKVSTFEAVPENYTQSLADVLKSYPAPEAPAKLSRR